MPARIGKKKSKINKVDKEIVEKSLTNKLSDYLSADLSKQVAYKVTSEVVHANRVFRIPKKKFDAGETNFKKYYRDVNYNTYPAEVKILWSLFRPIIDNNIPSGVSKDKLLLNFVHCYNQTDGYYLLMEICEMYNYDQAKKRWAVTHHNVWHSIKNTPNGDGSIASTTHNAHTVDIDNYEQKTYYYRNGKDDGNSEQIFSDRDATNQPVKYVRSLLFPWKGEILKMYEDNERLGITIARIGFNSYTEYEDSRSISNIPYPHGLAIYCINDLNQDLLDDSHSVVPFRMKGANFATLCKPNCAEYLDPS